MNKTKKVLSLFLVFIMIIGLIPLNNSTVYGDNSITVFVTISVKGDIVCPKDSNQKLLNIPLVVETGTTPAEALKKMHELYHPDGKDGYNETNGFFSTFWGQTTSNVGYFINDIMIMNTKQELSNGDYLNGTIYEDFTKDIYSCFDKKDITISVNESHEITLLSNVICTDDWKHGMMNGDFADKPLKNSSILILNNDKTSWDKKNITTDKNGKAIISFDKTGTYYISALKEGFTLIPAFCKITVTDELSYEKRLKIVEDDTKSLETINLIGTNTSSSAIVSNLYLPMTGESKKTRISWATSDQAIIANNGIVQRPLASEGDKNISIFANITYGNANSTKEFYFTVKALPNSEEVLSNIIKKLPTYITVKEWDGENKKDTNIIDVVQEKINNTNPTVKVKRTCNPNEQTQIDENGNITYGKRSVRRKKITLTLTLDNKIIEYSPSITVPKKSSTKEEALSGDWLTFDTIKSYNTSIDNVTTNLLLPKEDPNNYYTEIEWSTDNNNIISIPSYTTSGTYNVSITRPSLGEPDAHVILTAKIKPGMYWDYGMAPVGPMPNPPYTIKNFNITVPTVTAEEKEKAQKLIDEGIELFTLDNVTYRHSDEKANLTNLVYDINEIPYNWNYVDEIEGFKDDYRVAKVTWESKNPGITDITTGATITRTDKEQTGDIILTISYNGATAQKKFPTVVKAFTQEDTEHENNNLDIICDSLNFEVIKNTNTDIDAITEKLLSVKSGIINKDGSIEFTKTNKYNFEGAKITWKSNNTNIITNSLRVKRPTNNTNVTLTATLTSPKYSSFDGVKTLTKEFNVCVLGKGENVLLNNITNMYINKDITWWKDSCTWWNTVGLHAYEKYSGKDIIIEDDSKQVFVNKIIKLTNKSNPIVSSYANTLANTINSLSSLGYNPEEIYSLDNIKINAVELLKSIDIEEAKKGWFATVAPYVLQALNQNHYNCNDIKNKYIEYLINQLENTDWSFGVDTPAMVIQGLSPYYNDAKVNTVVNSMLTTLSNKQNSNGSFGSSNSDANVIIALSTLGINCNTDSRFIKNGKSLLDGLLTYTTDSQDGFGYQDNIYNEYATSQSYIAYICALEVAKTNNPFNPFDTNDLTKIAVYEKKVESTEPTNPTTPDEKEKIDVYFSLKTPNSTWISRKKVNIAKDSTVYDAFTKTLDNLGFNYNGASSNYVTSITHPDGTTLSEFSNGINSGWLYKVNNILPKVGLKDCTLENGDNIVYYYTQDWRNDSDASKLIEEDKKDKNNKKDKNKEENEIIIQFSDVNNEHPSYRYISELVKLGVFKGKPDGNFHPTDNIKRCETITLIARLSNELSTNQNNHTINFKDVKSDEWFYPYLIWATNNNIINGTKANCFSPNNFVSRQDFATIIERYLIYKGIDTNCDNNIHSFNDKNEIKDYALNAIMYLKQLNIIDGKPNNVFDPNAPITRADASKIIYLLIEYLNK